MNRSEKILRTFLDEAIQRMKALGLSQRSLAKRLGVSGPYVSKMFSGDVNISFGAADRLAHALQMKFCPQLMECDSGKK